MNIFFQRADLDSPQKHTDAKTNYLTDNVNSEDSDFEDADLCSNPFAPALSYEPKTNTLEPPDPWPRQKRPPHSQSADTANEARGDNRQAEVQVS